MSELTQILQAFDSFKTEIKQDISDMRTDIKEIKTVLAGDEFGNIGLVESQSKLATKLYTLRDEVRTIKVIGGVLYTIIGLLIAGLALFKH